MNNKQALDRINNIIKMSSPARADVGFILKDLMLTTLEEVKGEEIPIESAKSIIEREWIRREHEIAGYNAAIEEINQKIEEVKKRFR